MTVLRQLWTLLILAAGGSALALEPAEQLVDRLARLNATVAPAAEQKTVSTQVADAIRRRHQELNDQNTAAWQAVKSRADWEAFKKPKRAALEASLGQFPTPPKSLKVRVSSTVGGDGFRIDNLVFESRPGLWVTANLYRPQKATTSLPGILICHAHHTPKEHGELQDMGMTWARAGCFVLVMDQLGHGERRQHPFINADSYAKQYKVSRQDYYFRYDNGIQLQLAGDSLIGWMAWDLMRGVDLLLAQPGIDPKRIILLGSVAGGGDPAAVVAALDERIACVAPFNFGTPSPSPQYPYPPDQEPRWNYVGGGSWESTRNLRRSASDGFMPWVTVAAAAPRRLVYAHEFGWFKEGDPVWKRLQTVYGFYEVPQRLSFTLGKGDVTKKPPEGTHCTHIGSLHRKLMHDDFRRWFAIDVTGEYSNRLPVEKLRCWTPEAERELKPRRLSDLLSELARERVDLAREQQSGKTLDEQRRRLREQWARILGPAEPPAKPEGRRVSTEPLGNATIERVLLTTEPGSVVPLLLLLPRGDGKRLPVVVAVCQAGKARLLGERSADLAALLEAGLAVCLPDVRGTGESSQGAGRGRTSAATALSSSQLMLGETLVGLQLRDLRAVLAWLRSRDELDLSRLALWGDSLAPTNPPTTNFVVPRDDDADLPPQSEPLGSLLVLLTALYEDNIQAIYARGGLASFHSVLDGHLVLLPHDVVLPGALTTGDIADLVGMLAPRQVHLQGTVDGRNRRLSGEQIRTLFQPAVARYRERGAAAALTVQEEPTSAARWLLGALKKAR